MSISAKFLLLLSLAIVSACTTAPSAITLPPPMQELVPTGKLRVGIGVGPVSSAFWASRDPATGQPKGVTVDLGIDLAKKLGVPLEFVIYNNSGEVTAAGPLGEWDVAFMPMDGERARMVDFGPAYFLVESTYLVPAGSAAQTIADVDHPGSRVLGIEGTTTARSAARSLKQTKLQTVRTVDEIYEALRANKVDAVALGKESLQSLAASFPGSRVLPGHYQATGVAIAVPKNHPAALAYVSAYIEEAKTSGVVRRALDNTGMKDAAVAPPAERK